MSVNVCGPIAIDIYYGPLFTSPGKAIYNDYTVLPETGMHNIFKL